MIKTLRYFESILNALPMGYIRYSLDSSNSKLNEYQRGHILYLYAI